jgi:hypothetical protein
MNVTDDVVSRFLEILWGASTASDEFRAAAVVKGSRTRAAVRRGLEAVLNEDEGKMVKDEGKMIMHHYRPGDAHER